MLRYPSYRLEKRDSAFLDANLPDMMQDPLLVASSLILALRIYHRKPSREMLSYYGNTLTLLQARVQSHERTSMHTIFLSIIHLMVVEVRMLPQAKQSETLTTASRFLKVSDFLVAI